MPLIDIVQPQAIVPLLKSQNKKQALQFLAEKAAALSGLPERDIYDALLQRERLGSTGLGGGIAIPHSKLPNCEKIFGVFARLERPIDFDALDEAPVDLVFLLVVPEAAGGDYLNALARVARILRNPENVSLLRKTTDAAAIYSILVRDPTAKR